MTPDPRAFRNALGRFATGVTIVTACDGDGDMFGLTVNSFNSVSLDPPLVLWSLDRGSETFDRFAGITHFAVNILAQGQQDLSAHFAGLGRHGFNGVDHRRGEAGCPVFPDAAAWFECAVETRHDGGDHLIYIGRVLDFGAQDGAEPLVFCDGAYRQLR